VVGFAGIVSVLRPRSSPQADAMHRLRMRIMIETSACVLTFAFLPLLLVGAELPATPPRTEPEGHPPRAIRSAPERHVRASRLLIQWAPTTEGLRMLVPITALYAGILAIIVGVLGFQVGAARSQVGISILHGDDMDLAEKIRRHANFIENVPLALILMSVLELNGTGAGLLHGLGIALVLARIAHPIGLHHDNMRHPLRAVGAGGTFLVTGIAALAAIWQFVSA
jgi:uncharacterized membrane protein YecN with MAPEG domain